MTPHPLAHAAAEVARIDNARTAKVHTPCGEGRMVWRCWGRGRPLVLLHGGYGSWGHFIRNVVPLSRSRAVWACDLPGFGESDESPPPGTRDALAGVVDQALDVLFPGEVVDVIGFSYGGSIAAHMHRRKPHRYSRIVIVGSSGLPVPHSPRPELRKWKGSSTEERLAIHRYNLAAFMISKPERVDDVAVWLQDHSTRASRTRSGPKAAPFDMLELLADATARISGIWGEEDVTAKGHLDDRAAAFRTLRPPVTLHRIPDCGHWVPYEQAERFNALIEELLAQPA